MTLTKILVTLSDRIVGGADVKSVDTFYALKMIGYDISGLLLSFDTKKYFINYIKPLHHILEQKIGSYLTNYDKVIAIVTYPQYLYHLLSLKKTVGSRIAVLWYPGGNDFCCPLHTEVCPRSLLNSSYGCAYNLAFFLTYCIPHMLRLKRISIYHSLIWTNLRSKALRWLDGFLAARSIYIKGCKLIGYEKYFYVGFGINTAIFKPENKEKSTEMMAHLANKVLWGDFYSFLKDIREGNSIVIGYIGAAEPWWKNLKTLVLAFKRLLWRDESLPSAIRDRIRLLIISRAATRVLAIVKEMPDFIKKKIVVMDRIDYKKIPYAYNTIDVFVNPSYLDSLELNTLEALSSGNITLASNRGSIDDLTKYFNINILKFEPNSISLSNSLKNILLDLDNFRKIFTNESRKVRNFMGLEAFAFRLNNVIRHYVNNYDENKI